MNHLLALLLAVLVVVASTTAAPQETNERFSRVLPTSPLVRRQGYTCETGYYPCADGDGCCLDGTTCSSDGTCTRPCSEGAVTCPYTVGLCCPTLEQCGETVCSDPGYPTEPKDPGYPTEPTTDNTSYPTEPTDPGYPTEPTDPGYPTTDNTSYPTEPTDPGYPTEPKDPGYPTEPTDPGYPTEPTDPGYPTDNTSYPTDNTSYPTEPPTPPAATEQVTGFCDFTPVVGNDTEQVLGRITFLQTVDGTTIVYGQLNTGFIPTDATYTITCGSNDITDEVDPKPQIPGGIPPFQFTTSEFTLTATNPIRGKKCVVTKTPPGAQIGSCIVKIVGDP